jgi:outer membrane protein assembly factor BamA
LKLRPILLFSCLASLLFSCGDYDRYVIQKPSINQIKIIGNKKINTEDIRTNITGLKESNTRFISIRINSYLQSKRAKKDSMHQKQAFLRFFKKTPSLLNVSEIELNAKSLSKYYRSKGFLHNNITYSIDSLKKVNNTFNVTYFIQEGIESEFTKVDSLQINNPVLEEKINLFLKNESLIHPHKTLELEVIKQEKERLANHLKNQGYFYFSPEAVGIKINDVKDTTLHKISLIYKIPDFKANQLNNVYDRLFRYGPIDFRENAYVDEANIGTINAISKSSNELKKLVSIKENDLYSSDKLNYSLQNIYETDQFKSVSIQFDTNSTKIYPRIELIRNDKYNLSSELGGSSFRGIPGPFITNSLKIRRVFSELDFLEFTGRLGFEAQAGFINTDVTRKNLDISLGATANFPTLFLPSQFTSKLGEYYGAKTQMGIGYDYIDRPEYNRTNFKIFQRYLWRKSAFTFYQLSLVDLNVLNTNYPQTNTSQLFQTYLDELRIKGNNLYRSFNPSFVSSINFSYVHRTFIPTNGLVEGKALTLGIESGGTSLNFLTDNKIKFVENLLGNNQNMQFYRYLRFNFDYRKYHFVGLKRKSQIAFKLIGGLAYAYGAENGYQLPYEKNFFIGGPSSLRAWKPRRLGPGGYQAGSNLIEQPGSVLLESSIEYRFKMFKFLGDMNGAFFMDAGNIWSLTDVPNESGKFKFDSFMNQIALGTGFGLRWDFNYFLLRLDLATKMINPANPVNKKWVLSETSFSSGENPIEFNIGIGYPF